MMSIYSNFSWNVEAAQPRQWQRFLRTYLRCLTLPELQAYIRGPGPTVQSQTRVLCDESPCVVVEHMVGNLAQGGSHCSAYTGAAGDAPEITLREHAIRVPPAPKPGANLEDLLGDTPLGRDYLSVLERRGLDTLEKLRAAQDWDVGEGFREVVTDSKTGHRFREIAPASDTYAPATDSPADRLLHILYDLKVALPRRELSRYHAMCEWQASVQETLDARSAAVGAVAAAR
jgi:hypothetical protein